MSINQVIDKVELNPKELFMIDGIGAILSAFLLGVVLVKFESIFGIPSSTLYFLAAIPICFATYDFYCYHKENSELAQFVKGIAIMNFLYCCLSLGFAFYHVETITSLGWTYILIEIVIVIILATIELKVAKKLITKYDTNYLK